MRKFNFNECKVGDYLCIESIETVPNLPSTGFGGIDSNVKKYAKITNISFVNDVPYIVSFDILNTKEKNLPMTESAFNDDGDVWVLPKTIYNPYGGKVKFYFCDEDDLPKSKLEIIIFKIFNQFKEDFNYLFKNKRHM